jgi:hypothetical protein
VSGSLTVVTVVVRMSSAHGAGQHHNHRFLIPVLIAGDPSLTIGYVKVGEAIT